MNMINKLRLKHTLYVTMVTAVVMLVFVGGFIGIFAGGNRRVAEKVLDLALNCETERSSDMGSSRCFVFVLNGKNVTFLPAFSGDVAYYADEISAIVHSAVAAENGRFTVNKSVFRVASKQIDGYMKYAVYDGTADHDALQFVGLLSSILYFAALLVITILSYAFSTFTTAPVKQAVAKQRDLVANASHELKTPLTIISTNLAVLKSEPNSKIEDNEKWISSIDGQIERMNGLIKNMLELSKLESSDIPKELLDFGEIVERACLEFEVVCYEKNIKLLTRTPRNLLVMGDRSALERLVMILLDNAVKYCGENGKIGCKLSADNKKIRLEVMNTGAVISPEDAKRVFDRFYRADGARTNKDGNSFGLGLAIANATVIGHGGRISCKGIEDKGSVFSVILPVAKHKDVARSTYVKQSDESKASDLVEQSKDVFNKNTTVRQADCFDTEMSDTEHEFESSVITSSVNDLPDAQKDE